MTTDATVSNALSTLTTIVVDGFVLFQLGLTKNDRKVWRHLPTADFETIGEIFPKAGYEYGCHQLESGEWAWGWTETAQLKEVKPPTPLLKNIVPVEVKSDTVLGRKYLVHVDLDAHNGTGKPLSCTCPAGEHLVPCKHLHRGLVIASGSIRAAAQALVKEGAYAKEEHFWLTFSKRADEIGINMAITEMIEAGLGVNHPHCVDYKVIAKAAVAKMKAVA